MDNKRRFGRVNAVFDVTLCADDGLSVTGILRDVAIQGAFVACEPIIPLGTPVDVTIMLQGGHLLRDA